MRWNDPPTGCGRPTRPTRRIVSPEDFDQAQAQMAAGAHRPTTVKQHRREPDLRPQRPVHCGLCGRRMQGNLQPRAPHYRCQFPTEHAPSRALDHPKTVYVRESAIVPKLDEWIADSLRPGQPRRDLQARWPARADRRGSRPAKRRERKLADCDERLDKYRAGARRRRRPASWPVDGRSPGRAAQGRAGTRRRPSRRAARRRTRCGRSSMASTTSPRSGDADPKLKAEVYAELGDQHHLRPDQRIVAVESRPRRVCTESCRRGDLNPHALAGTSPSSWRVCLFRHSDEHAMGK